MHLTKTDLENTNRIKRLNIINSLSGIKPANLIGTVSADKINNVAIFNSVVHIGSNPALIGFIIRPTGEVPRNTYDNLMRSGYYTINHVKESLITKAHYTSAKFDETVSEFEKCKLTTEYLNEFEAPFVEESIIKMGVKFVEEVPIKINDTALIIGEIRHLYLPDNIITEEGYLDLATAETAGISGLNSYYGLSKIADYPYARPGELPDF